ncbi:Rv1733c family protein [Actinomadura madurae]|uniref:Rv1733c family protein n=1 Tax=Actinomadura madurae TaxID=1993 RepID=UPI0020275ED2|nr:hypothetical protein [Actinomadura madurae]MCP9948950.1 hypothetical protein [Actinomadura madurae]MCP9965722.1 hypothetical protein [Actinomadura madurae]MCP9978196.1 hypothetical protein [Actinomadura madurae]MCQ0010286.1 hypothetical protein [Actinomadura madurae]MCQ0014402.1 hypothetical protein [Actinomadura madurae]
MRAAIRARADRWRRSCGFDANDLRRDVDRVQWRLGLLLLMIFFSVTPPLCAHVAGDVYHSGVKTERHEAATRHRVVATIVNVEPDGQRRTTIAWTAADGTRHTRDHLTVRGGQVGDRLIVWVGPDAVSMFPPRRHALTIIHTAAIGAGVVPAVGLPLLSVYMLVRKRCDRHRSRQWDAEWVHLDDHRIGP